jgi:hypothetical protein
VSNIEAIQQTLSISLDTAYIHVFVPVEALIWIRSIAIVLLIVAHAVRHLGRTVDVAVKTAKPKLVKVELAQPVPPAHEECASQILPAPVNKNFLRVKEYLSHHPDASARTVAQALGMSATTANKWMQKARNTA